MTPKEKRTLVLNPLLEEMESYGYFIKNSYLYCVNRSGQYCVAVRPGLFSNGCMKDLIITFGTFFRECTLSKYGAMFGEIIILNAKSELSQYTDETVIDELCCASAADLTRRVKASVLPHLKQIHDLPSFIEVAERLDEFNPNATWHYGRAWDYMALGQRERAYQFLNSIIHHPWYEARGLMPNHRPSACQLLEELQRLDDVALRGELRKRAELSERTCRGFFGARRWSKC